MKRLTSIYYLSLREAHCKLLDLPPRRGSDGVITSLVKTPSPNINKALGLVRFPEQRIKSPEWKHQSGHSNSRNHLRENYRDFAVCWLLHNFLFLRYSFLTITSAVVNATEERMSENNPLQPAHFVFLMFFWCYIVKAPDYRHLKFLETGNLLPIILFKFA